MTGLTNIPTEGTTEICRNSAGRLATFNSIVYPQTDYNERPFDAKFRETTVEVINGPTDVKEFVYNGRVGDALKFVYREFKNNYARPAFTQEVQYDLSQSDEIGFQNLKLKVIDASNTSIEYLVIQNF